MRTSRSVKIIAILLLVVVVKMLFGCWPRSHPPQEITYNSISVGGVDNSGEYVQSYGNTDTMYSDAVALVVALYDSTYLKFEQTVHQSMELLSYSSAMAFSIDYSYISTNKVLDIKVSTVFDIDDNVKAGDDISDNILYDFGINSFSVYKDKNQVISRLNGTQSSQAGSFCMFLKKSVINDKAQFKVDVLLVDDKHLTCLSDTFTIIN